MKTKDTWIQVNIGDRSCLLFHLSIKVLVKLFACSHVIFPILEPSSNFFFRLDAKTTYLKHQKKEIDIFTSYFKQLEHTLTAGKDYWKRDGKRHKYILASLSSWQDRIAFCGRPRDVDKYDHLNISWQSQEPLRQCDFILWQTMQTLTAWPNPCQNGMY